MASPTASCRLSRLRAARLRNSFFSLLQHGRDQHFVDEGLGVLRPGAVILLLHQLAQDAEVQSGGASSPLRPRAERTLDSPVVKPVIERASATSNCRATSARVSSPASQAAITRVRQSRE